MRDNGFHTGMRSAFRLRAALFLILLPLAAAGQAPAGKGVLLWRVDSGASTVYLLGSVHVAREDIYPLNVYIERAFDSSVRLAVEADVRKMDQARVQDRLLELGVLPADRTLSDVLGPGLAARVRDRFAALGRPAAAFERFKPWVVYSTLTSLDLAALGYGGENGVDLHFLRRSADREVVELESIDYQLELLSGFPDADMAALLAGYLDESAELPGLTAELFQAWLGGDQARLEGLLAREMGSSEAERRVGEALLRNRDAGMTERIRELLNKPGTSFVVVGAGHLVGAGSIVDLLGRAGYRVAAVTE